jgi:hypothetical protein
VEIDPPLVGEAALPLARVSEEGDPRVFRQCAPEPLVSLHVSPRLPQEDTDTRGHRAPSIACSEKLPRIIAIIVAMVQAAPRVCHSLTPPQCLSQQQGRPLAQATGTDP